MTTQFAMVLSVLLLIGFLTRGLLRLRLAAKAKAYDARKSRVRHAQQLASDHLPPSWHENGNRKEEFFSGAAWLATRKGVSSPYAHAVVAKEVNVRRLLWYVGALEVQGATWAEQQMAVAEQIVEWWELEERAQKWASQNLRDE